MLTTHQLMIAALAAIVCWLIYNGQIRTQALDREWSMAPGYSNTAEAAQLLDDTNRTMIEFMRRLRAKYGIGATSDGPAPPPSRRKDMATALLTRYDPDNFYENDPRRSVHTSFTNNKGDSMAICLRNRADPTRLVDPGLMMFVHLHESAHIANFDDFGHTAKFWSTFKWLLIEAVEAGIYTAVDYSAHPQYFCGLLINHNPVFDTAITPM